MTRFLSKLRLPKLLSRSRWDRIRMTLDAYPRMVEHLEQELRRKTWDCESLTEQLDAAELQMRQDRSAANLLSIEREDGGRLIQAVVRY